ncbi:uncharacterized protein LOC122014036 [Zingiber officinale]|uniref:Uncharacterized protein n=1 Tax=Zingiber officinale TaxID=94328 RepID=A0A8J5FGM0_ZINOF|nr:uncharacterized protein LOC122014036 [Zingiber officinale]KAG6483710.1 hypothetical protein ZIOFF_060362 [Zingiber officinale]
MATHQHITLKLLVNKTKNCVALVESDLDFVDVLLSFLTLPVGTVVRLLNKQSSLGCFDKLYHGVEQLDKKYLVTAACKSMLTNPVSSSGVRCQKLKINVDEMGNLYTCICKSCPHRTFSYYPSAKCLCGGDLHKSIRYDLNQDYVNYEELHGVFIKGAKFAVTDDLSVSLIEHAMSSLNECCNGDWGNMEERLVKIEQAQVSFLFLPVPQPIKMIKKLNVHMQVLQILKRSLVSDTPLSDVLLRNGEGISPKFSVPLPVEKTVAIKASDKEKKIFRIKLALMGNKVLYAEAAQDFVDVIFSFLAFPLGALKKHLGSRFRIACLNNLYGSAELLASSGYVVSGCEERLLNPKLAPYFNCKHQVIGVEERKQDVYYACPLRCKLSARRYYCHSHHFNRPNAKPAKLIDPKRHPRWSDSADGSYCKKLMYLVSDELVVVPLSLTAVISVSKEISGTVKMAELGIAEEEVLDLLNAALSSKTALTDAFLARVGSVPSSVERKGESSIGWKRKRGRMNRVEES